VFARLSLSLSRTPCAQVADPWGGSYMMEALTDAIATRARSIIAEVRAQARGWATALALTHAYMHVHYMLGFYMGTDVCMYVSVRGWWPGGVAGWHVPGDSVGHAQAAH
jgi:hypothetical protein